MPRQYLPQPHGGSRLPAYAGGARPGGALCGGFRGGERGGDWQSCVSYCCCSALLWGRWLAVSCSVAVCRKRRIWPHNWIARPLLAAWLYFLLSSGTAYATWCRYFCVPIFVSALLLYHFFLRLKVFLWPVQQLLFWQAMACVGMEPFGWLTVSTAFLSYCVCWHWGAAL